MKAAATALDPPAHWRRGRLDEFAEVQLGRQRSPKNHTGPNMRKYLRAANVTWKGLNLVDVMEMNFNPDEAERFRLREDDLLLAEGSGSPDEVGKPALWKGEIEDCCFQNTLIRVRPGPLVSSRYLLHLFGFEAQVGHFGSASRGVNIHHLGSRTLAAWPVAVPPMDEQHRIVEAIEEQFSRLDVGVESLHRAKRNLSGLRASIVTSAVYGRIVGLGPSEESTSTGLFSIPRGWAWQRTEDVAVVSGGIQKQPKRKPKDNAFPYLRVANVHRGVLHLGEVYEMELFGAELARYRLEVGDLLVVEGNGSESQIGRSAMWGGEIQDCVHQNHIIRVRPGRALDARFLNLYWNSPPAARRVRAVAASTSGLYTLSTSKVKAVPIPVPPLEVQQAIVAEVDRQLSVVDAMLGAVEAASIRASKLRGAVLREAFSGGLDRGSGSVGATTA